jgi:hypothetical protein
MLDPETIAQRYLAIWNERDGARRKSLIGALWTRDASFVDPVAKGDGIDEIDAVIGGIQTRFPDFSFTQLGKADGFGDYVRLTWELGPQGGDAPIQGTDFAVIENDHLKSVTGFFDRVPQQ